MPRHTKTLLTLTLTTLTLALTLAGASANRLSVSGQTIRITWTSLRLHNTQNTNFFLCPVTLEGSFHSNTITKTVGALIGYITRASIRGSGIAGECTGGTVTIRQESLPWHIRYRSFTGTLPNITGLTFGLIGVRFHISEPGLTCNASSEASNPIVGTASIRSGVAESMTPEPNARIPLEGEFGICGLSRGFFESESQTLTALGTTTRITITLI